MTTEEKIDRITNIVGALADSVLAHDHQIGQLATEMQELKDSTASIADAAASLERQWQAYINTLPRH